MAIENTGWQVRYDGGAQLLLEYDASFQAQFEVDSAGALSIAPNGDSVEITGTGAADVEFTVSPAAANFDAIINGGVSGTGVTRINSDLNELQFSIADAIIGFVDADGYAPGPTATVRVQEGAAANELALIVNAGSAPILTMYARSTGQTPVFNMYDGSEIVANKDQFQMRFTNNRFTFQTIQNGSPGNPVDGFRFLNQVEMDAGTQFFADAASGIGFMSGGVQVADTALTFSATGGDHVILTVDSQIALQAYSDGAFFGVPIYAPDGTEAIPSIAFGNNEDVGFYLDAGPELHVVIDGTSVAFFDSTGLASPSSFTLSDGSAAAPSLKFSSDTDTGFYYDTTDIGPKWVHSGSITAAMYADRWEFRNTSGSVAPLRIEAAELNSGGVNELFYLRFDDGDVTNEQEFSLRVNTALDRDFDFVWTPASSVFDFRFVMNGVTSALTYDSNGGQSNSGRWNFGRQVAFANGVSASVNVPNILLNSSVSTSGLSGDSNGRLYFVVSGAWRFLIYNNEIQFNVQMRAATAAGDIDDPHYSFVASPEGGMYYDSTFDFIALKSPETGGGAYTRIIMLNSEIQMDGQVVAAVSAGTAGAPSFAVNTTNDDGMYWDNGVSEISFSIGGTKVASIDSNGFILPTDAIEFIGDTQRTALLTINAGAIDSATVTVTGAAVGDMVVVNPDDTNWNDLITVTAYVSAVNTVTVVYQNGSSTNVTSENLDCDVRVLRVVT